MPQKSKIPAEEKVRIVEEYLNGKIGYADVKEIIGIHSKTMQSWISRYRAEETDGFLRTERNRIYPAEGFQYTNRVFHQKLVATGMTQSMSRVGCCIDNGPMEGFWGTIEREIYYGSLPAARYWYKHRLHQLLQQPQIPAQVVHTCSNGGIRQLMAA